MQWCFEFFDPRLKKENKGMGGVVVFSVLFGPYFVNYRMLFCVALCAYSLFCFVYFLFVFSCCKQFETRKSDTSRLRLERYKYCMEHT
jgi:hypothetical protein